MGGVFWVGAEKSKLKKCMCFFGPPKVSCVSSARCSYMIENESREI